MFVREWPNLNEYEDFRNFPRLCLLRINSGVGNS